MNLPPSRDENIVVQEIDNETLVYDLSINKAFCLNQISAIVFNACGNKQSVQDLKVKHNLTEDIIYLALDELDKNNLLQSGHKYHSPLAGTSRREVIRRIGLASVVVLPLVSALVAPTSANAASNSLCSNPALDSCITNSDCAGSSTGDTCTNNCCTLGGGIPGSVCIPSPTNVCPPTPPGCDPIFGC